MTLTVKIILITIGFALFALVGWMTSTIYFQGHIHPDDWQTIWQDGAVLSFVLLAYVVVLYRVVMKHFDS